MTVRIQIFKGKHLSAQLNFAGLKRLKFAANRHPVYALVLAPVPNSLPQNKSQEAKRQKDINTKSSRNFIFILNSLALVLRRKPTPSFFSDRP